MVASTRPKFVIGIGASAGGLNACRAFLQAMPVDSGMAIVIVMHLDPKRESHLAEIFRGSTSLAVTEVTSPQRLEPNHVYVIVPDSSLELRGGLLNPHKPDDPHGHRHPVDKLFTSLAADQKERTVAIVLSGTGSNGAQGIRDVKAQGGLCLAQDPATAEYDGMPQSAIDTGLIDEVLPPDKMPAVILRYAEHDGVSASKEGVRRPPSEAFELILELLSRTYRVNFRSAYKRGTLVRRTGRRMGLRRIPDWDAYLELLRSDPDEVAALYSDILVGVTRFFRDPEIWEELETNILPGLLARHGREMPLKCWVPGCATGEEAYTLAIVLREAIERSGDSNVQKFQIFATDISETSLDVARKGVYSASIAETVSAERLSRFFRPRGERFEVVPDVRDALTFAVHNLLADPPFSNVDLVSCRNVLIYLEQHAQQRVLELFHFALRPGGVLLLGGSEAAGKHGNIFEAVSHKARIYRPTAKSETARQGPIVWTPASAPTPAFGFKGEHAPIPSSPKGPTVSRLIEQIVLGRYTAACVVVNELLEIQSFFGPTNQYLAQPTGEARLDLLAWTKPGIYPRLRSALDRARDRKERLTVTDMKVERDGTFHPVECVIEPIIPLPGEAPLFLISFRDVQRPVAAEEAGASTSAEPLARQLEAENRELRGELQTALEQLDSTNQEHRASHEELLSLNEELQSNNEEVQASKEELQSLNEEMVTINRQLEERNAALRTTTADLNNLLVSADIPIIFLDRELRVRRFTPSATLLMRLVPEDLGRSIEHIKERSDDLALISDAQKVLQSLISRTVDVRADNGHWYTRTIRPYRTDDDRVDGVCIAFFDITKLKAAAVAHEDARRSAEALVRESPGGLLVLDEAMRVVIANDAFCKMFQVSRTETEGVVLFDLGNRQWDIPRLRDLLERVVPEASEIRDYEVTHNFAQLGQRTMLLHARRMSRGDKPPYLLLSVEDLTERRIVEESLRNRADVLEREHARRNEFLAMLGHELRNPLAAVSYGLDLLRIHQEDAGRREEIRSMMQRQTRRIVGMLDQLLDAARLTSGKTPMTAHPVNLKDAVRAALEAVTPLLESRRHTVSVSLPSEDLLVKGDPVRLTQVVENLVGNAAKYMDEGGKITLMMEQDGDWVRLHVKDAGIGIEAGLLPYIFDLFAQGPQSLDRAAGGLGLGLPLAKQIVTMHGGRLEAKSAGRGLGSEFTVVLPRIPSARSKAPPRNEESSLPSRETQHRILVVDDQDDVREPLADLLKDAGHAVLAAPDGPSALAAVSSFRPDVALIDLGMPQMDGYEVARRIREKHADHKLCLIAVTGYQSDAARLKEAGFDRHLIKPISPDQLLAAVVENDSAGETSAARSGVRSQRGPKKAAAHRKKPSGRR